MENRINKYLGESGDAQKTGNELIDNLNQIIKNCQRDIKIIPKYIKSGDINKIEKIRKTYRRKL